DATVTPAHSCGQARTGQYVHDFENVLHGDVERRGEVDDFHQRSLGARAGYQDPDGIAGRFIEPHGARPLTFKPSGRSWPTLPSVRADCAPARAVSRRYLLHI